eukprot:CAMPEP_0179056786 /NCGR_PEP_ID=MMETSP0796-20121207/23991_1 /TAXON_ID=73915 /ORGANISM="Pyrodinium bahamense, Strain pbaha01" /LENGTH=234 /DNA_ID=CAMNT_0020753471 /DNA_START=76 /DNA_END=780 /DNA_ORIENTATION=+
MHGVRKMAVTLFCAVGLGLAAEEEVLEDATGSPPSAWPAFDYDSMFMLQRSAVLHERGNGKAAPNNAAASATLSNQSEDGSALEVETFVTYDAKPSHTPACPSVTPVHSGFSVDEYTRASWYVQEQQTISYQRQDQLNCVVATYDFEGSAFRDPVNVPLFWGDYVKAYNFYEGGRPTADRNNNPVPSLALCGSVLNPHVPSALAIVLKKMGYTLSQLKTVRQGPGCKYEEAYLK